MARYEFSVTVEPQYLPDESEPAADRYFFAYTVTIINTGEQSAQLISRHWIITDGEGKVEEVRGDGVVGEQPQLAPGEAFQYTSGCPLPTQVGSMRGTYQMVTDAGERFDAEIAPFTLAFPGALN